MPSFFMRMLLLQPTASVKIPPQGYKLLGGGIPDCAQKSLLVMLSRPHLAMVSNSLAVFKARTLPTVLSPQYTMLSFYVVRELSFPCFVFGATSGAELPLLLRTSRQAPVGQSPHMVSHKSERHKVTRKICRAGGHEGQIPVSIESHQTL